MAVKKENVEFWDLLVAETSEGLVYSKLYGSS